MAYEFLHFVKVLKSGLLVLSHLHIVQNYTNTYNDQAALLSLQISL